MSDQGPLAAEEESWNSWKKRKVFLWSLKNYERNFQFIFTNELLETKPKRYTTSFFEDI